MKAYRLQCLNEDGMIENNGYYSTLEKAEESKEEMNSWPMNKRYGIKQDIIEIEIQD